MAEEQIGKYQVLGELGKGSMGMVYRAEDPEIGRIVAIKTLRSVYMGADAAGQEALQRFRQEARSAGMLKHPNIVTIFETGRTESGSPYIVMEYIEGDSLETRLGKPMEPLEALHLLGQIGSAIDYAHGFHMVHRDIKPSNVIIDAQNMAHLLDFGVAKLNDTSLTPAGTVVGTPSYMAPEQIRGETLDGATDRFALAVVAYEMLVGSRPFPGTDFMTVVSNIIHTEPIPFSQAKTAALPEFEPILRKGLNKDRSQRYASCLELVRALAKPFNVTIDHAGVLGYRQGMRLEDLQTGKKGPALTAGDKGDNAATMIGRVPESLLVAKGTQKGSTEATGKGTVEPAPKGGGAGRLIFAFILLLLLAGIAGAAYVMSKPDLRAKVMQRIHPSPKAEPTAESIVAVEATPTSAEVAVVVPTSTPAPVETAMPTPEAVVTAAPVETPVTITSMETPAPTSSPSPTVECSLKDGCGTPESINPAHAAMLERLGDSSQTDVDLIATIGKLTDPKYSDIPYADITPVLLKLVQHPNFKVRIAVLKVFTSAEKYRTREVFRVIVDRLDDNEFLVRGFTVKFLASLNNEAGMRLLQARLPKEQDATVKKLIEDTLQKK